MVGGDRDGAAGAGGGRARAGVARRPRARRQPSAAGVCGAHRRLHRRRPGPAGHRRRAPRPAPACGLSRRRAFRRRPLAEFDLDLPGPTFRRTPRSSRLEHGRDRGPGAPDPLRPRRTPSHDPDPLRSARLSGRPASGRARRLARVHLGRDRPRGCAAARTCSSSTARGSSSSTRLRCRRPPTRSPRTSSGRRSPRGPDRQRQRRPALAARRRPAATIRTSTASGASTRDDGQRQDHARDLHLRGPRVLGVPRRGEPRRGWSSSIDEHVSRRRAARRTCSCRRPYRPRNRWNTSTTEGAMHLVQGSNTLGAEIELAGGRAWSARRRRRAAHRGRRS